MLPDDRVCYRRVAERQGATGVFSDDRACYRVTGCATGVLPDDRVCYRRVAELPGVFAGRTGLLPVCERPAVLPNDRV